MLKNYKYINTYISGEINTNELNIYNNDVEHIFNQDLTIHGKNNDTNLIKNIISNNDTIVDNNITVKNDFINFNEVNYETIKITNNLTTNDSLNTNNDMYIPEPIFERIKTKSVSIDNSAIFSQFYIPEIHNQNYINGSIAYNPLNDSIFTFLNNKSHYINKKGLNENFTTGIVQNYPTINFIQNNNLVSSINYINKSFIINKSVSNIYNNLNIFNDLNIVDYNFNTKINNNLYIDNSLIFKENTVFSIISNSNNLNNIYNGSIRYNDKYDTYEKYVNNKWTIY